MSSEPTLPSPSAPTTVGRNWWKVVGIITIVLALMGGVAAAGYVIGNSDDDDVATPPTTVAPATTAAPVSIVDEVSDAMSAIEASNARADEIMVDFRANWTLRYENPYNDAFGHATETFRGNTTCDERSAALVGYEIAKQQAEVYRDGLRAELKEEEQRLLLVRDDTENPGTVRRAAAESWLAVRDYSTEISRQTDQSLGGFMIINTITDIFDENC